jgi:hypothetical protein
LESARLVFNNWVFSTLATNAGAQGKVANHLALADLDESQLVFDSFITDLVSDDLASGNVAAGGCGDSFLNKYLVSWGESHPVG